MASCLRFTVDGEKIRDEIRRLERQAELNRHLYFINARKIQSWFRGVATRNHLRALNATATVIQRHWRGHRARRSARNALTDRVNAMWRDRYDVLATRIQAAWRGYRARKNGIDVYRAKRWISSVYERNRICQEKMRSFREAELEKARNDIESQSLSWLLFVLFKIHHLLGTKKCPGIVTSADQTRLTTIEGMIKCLKYKDYVEAAKIKNSHCVVDKSSCDCSGRVKKCEGAIKDVKFQGQYFNQEK